MKYYHTLIITKDNSVERIVDLSEDDLLKKIIEPYEQAGIIFINGTSINSVDIGRIHIRETSEKYNVISERLYQEEKFRRDMNTNFIDLTAYGNYENAFWEGVDVLDNYIQGPAGYKIAEEEKKHKEKNNLETKVAGNKVFIVHGHNEEMKQTTARFLEKFDLEPIILHEQPNQGRTIIEKFSDYSDVSYAIVLLSADDLAFIKNDTPDNAKFRARQNVILELGYFLGKLGRDKVVAIFEQGKDIEIPSDFSGILYLGYSGDESWKLMLAKELKATGFDIDLNNLL
ncbi:nucleotide-binding protein [Chryseobacterium luquanense]|uniref:Nucleotide-binding protein n=1 Tax=Chryseobacterium luquanense TaxID=2983766 RepID=A0ABT3Y9E4_9FLAO|nr:nucleotide-binding protein [Chryseobacterium luquanense]MCX8534606.1 nucleotide-binding protein [Chryseobacterium luquanense]